MFKKFLLAGCLALGAAVGARAESLTPTSCGTGMRDFSDGTILLTPFFGCEMEFHGLIALGENPQAVVTHNGEIVARSTNIEETRPEWYQGEYDYIVIDFEPVNLPKGERYVFTLTAGSVMLKSDPTVTNDDIAIKFRVPANLNDHVTMVSPKYDAKRRYIGVKMSLCIDAVAIGEPQWELRRNDEVIGKYAASVNNTDRNLSYCSTDFPAVTFDADADYTLVLPAGSFGAKSRMDITNDDIELFLHHADQSGIDEVAAGPEAPAELFDLNGRRLTKAPAGGIYLERRGSKTIKRTVR